MACDQFMTYAAESDRGVTHVQVDFLKYDLEGDPKHRSKDRSAHFGEREAIATNRKFELGFKQPGSGLHRPTRLTRFEARKMKRRQNGHLVTNNRRLQSTIGQEVLAQQIDHSTSVAGSGGGETTVIYGHQEVVTPDDRRFHKSTELGARQNGEDWPIFVPSLNAKAVIHCTPLDLSTDICPHLPNAAESVRFGQQIMRMTGDTQCIPTTGFIGHSHAQVFGPYVSFSHHQSVMEPDCAPTGLRYCQPFEVGLPEILTFSDGNSCVGPSSYFQSRSEPF
ncbi:hypothetical protein H2200_007549 [Cladophialophora chaetospira]|uniref:Uncharacterized protein n=1 Tax=Cladophialophora chaetospira TaxID=386627 RepID=A0AA39CH58_9EURO|nr:hypothetical protein H2200_007549 [Cladophialophora chaetospira]